MAFEKTCTLCKQLIENTDLSVDLRESREFDMKKLIEANSFNAHVRCFQKSILNREGHEQLNLFK